MPTHLPEKLRQRGWCGVGRKGTFGKTAQTQELFQLYGRRHYAFGRRAASASRFLCGTVNATERAGAYRHRNVWICQRRHLSKGGQALRFRLYGHQIGRCGAAQAIYGCVDNKIILENATWLKQSGIKHTFRTPLIPDITDTEENLNAIEQIVGNSPWEKLAYNPLAGAKYASVGRTFDLHKGNDDDV